MGVWASKIRIIVRAAFSLLRDEEGQATTEYILLLSGTIVAAGAMSRVLIGVLDQGITHLGSQLEKNLKTGRAPASVWFN